MFFSLKSIFFSYQTVYRSKLPTISFALAFVLIYPKIYLHHSIWHITNTFKFLSVAVIYLVQSNINRDTSLTFMPIYSRTCCNMLYHIGIIFEIVSSTLIFACVWFFRNSIINFTLFLFLIFRNSILQYNMVIPFCFNFYYEMVALTKCIPFIAYS